MPSSRSRALWRLLRRAAQLSGLALAVFALVLVVDGWRAFGKAAEGARLARMQASPQYGDGGFVNPQPLYNDFWLGLRAFVDGSAYATPSTAIPVVALDRSRFSTPPSSGLRVTWLGHSTMVLEIDGRIVLTDPVWGERTSPVDWLGPARWYAPPLALDQLPPLDAVVISHDHYDHLDEPTITALKDWDTTFVVPLGVAAHLVYWGVPESRIVELDWWQHHAIGELEITATPARHASGRTLLDKDDTLWAGYAIAGGRHRVYFSGDTGLFPGMIDIGARLGPFDLTMIEVGAYGAGWPDWHLGPEQAVVAHRLVRGTVLLPVHWGLFDLAAHGWTEPIERVRAAAGVHGIDYVSPRPGEGVEPARAGEPEQWWPSVPWKTAAEDPIVATKVGDIVLP